jgi:CxxC motif-containing protein (DUF1111 family)
MSPARRLGLALLVGIAAGTAIGVAAAENERGAFGEPRAEAGEIERKIFRDGLQQFSRAWDENDGVGERFNAHSCLGCHSAPAAGGSGIKADTFVLVSNDISDAGGGHFFRRFQRTEDGVIELPAPLGAAKRKPPSLFGLGLLNLAALRQPTAPAPGPDKLKGKLGGTAAQPGRFGWKARVPDIKTFTATAFAQELGVAGKAAGRDYPLELAVEEVAAFIALLGPPPRSRDIDASARVGERIFAAIGCTQCHTPSLMPTHKAEAELGYRPEIRAYTDLLLHDMGAGLADGVVEGDAGPADFRTPPLWGVSSSGPPYLHDGRAKDLSEAIAMHDGQARNTRARWQQLSAPDRAALISFLQSL